MNVKNIGKDVIVFVNAIRPATVAALRAYEQATGHVLLPIILTEEKIVNALSKHNAQTQLPRSILRITADFDSSASLRQALNPYKDRVLVITSQFENSILDLRKLIPYFPDLLMPTGKSLEWATQKQLMRELLESHDTSLVPRFIKVNGHSREVIKQIEAATSYPVVIKPTALSSSMLVTRVENRAELIATLKNVNEKIQEAYEKRLKREKPDIVVEEFMEGDMYSIDTYVSPNGTCRHTPPVKVITGRKIGFDDFSGYMQCVPSGLSKEDIASAHNTAEQACKALELRSVTAHVELMKTDEGWKIIELGPRVGGFRHEIYERGYGINHLMNDVLNRAGKTPKISSTLINHTAYFKIYARQEGVLASIEGLRKIRQLPSFISLSQGVKVGQPVRFAKNNGEPVLMVVLSHKDKKQFEEDVRTLEHSLHLHTHASDNIGNQPLPLAPVAI